ncbi:DUF1206 domain-containing protein [Caulobacter sp. 1776]|uniref:DUF1206 domain-containing protein n=1 Tax=Caulobacter sp. 1776 TaxID=3156420 RepID=UPI0033947A83
MRRQAPALLKRLDLATVLEWASRGGYAARGLVYLGLGGIVLLAALDLTPRARGARGLLATWSQWPLGSILIGAIGFGLLGFAAWRALQAVFDADRHGRSAKALAIRLGQAVSGVIYGALAFSAFELRDQFEDFGAADEERSAQALAGRLLATPHGDGLLLLAGALMFAVGVGNIVQGFAQDFGKRLDCGERLCRRVVVLGRIGYGARGLATLPTGAFLARAGWQTRSSDAHSWAGALQALEGQPFGEWMLAMIAVGLLAFGLFGLVEAAFRRIRPVTPIHQSHGAA